MKYIADYFRRRFVSVNLHATGHQKAFSSQHSAVCPVTTPHQVSSLTYSESAIEIPFHHTVVSLNVLLPVSSGKLTSRTQSW